MAVPHQDPLLVTPPAPGAPAPEDRARAGRRRSTGPAALIGPALILGALALYTRTMAPSLGGTTDSSEFQQAAVGLTIVHPTGYPLYLLLAHLWLTVFPLGDPAYRVAFLSGMFAAAAVGVLYALLRQVTGQRSLAAGTAVLFAVQAI